MLQSMLMDRFKLAMHRDTKEVSVYNLVLVKTGRVKLSDDQTPPDPAAPPVRLAPGAPPPRGHYSLGVDPPAGKVMIAATAVPITNIINMFQEQQGRLVVDKNRSQRIDRYSATDRRVNASHIPGKFQLPVRIVASSCLIVRGRKTKGTKS